MLLFDHQPVHVDPRVLAMADLMIGSAWVLIFLVCAAVFVGAVWVLYHLIKWFITVTSNV